jgi:hypothetical protein
VRRSGFSADPTPHASVLGTIGEVTEFWEYYRVGVTDLSQEIDHQKRRMVSRTKSRDLTAFPGQ